MTEVSRPWRRRAVIAGAGLAAAGWVMGAPRLAGLWPSRLAYRDMPGLSPFRTVEMRGALSTGAGVLLGLERTEPDVVQEAHIAAVRADPCAALFGPDTGARLPIAFFSDFNCPNCRVLDAIFVEYDVANPGTIRMVRHELPLLGEASAIASRAVLAADLQGGYVAMHDRLLRTRMVTDLNLIASIATSLGLDADRLVADMNSTEITAALSKAKAIATVFGFFGTPSTVIGRTAFLGALPAADISQIIETELAALPMACKQT